MDWQPSRKQGRPGACGRRARCVSFDLSAWESRGWSRASRGYVVPPRRHILHRRGARGGGQSALGIEAAHGTHDRCPAQASPDLAEIGAAYVAGRQIVVGQAHLGRDRRNVARPEVSSNHRSPGGRTFRPVKLPGRNRTRRPDVVREGTFPPVTRCATGGNWWLARGSR